MVVVEMTLRPGAFAWRHGVGHEIFPHGTQLRGELVRVNEQKRVAIISCGASRYTVNLEDLERLPREENESPFLSV